MLWMPKALEEENRKLKKALETMCAAATLRRVVPSN
jgi:hypothetical protein